MLAILKGWFSGVWQWFAAAGAVLSAIFIALAKAKHDGRVQAIAEVDKAQADTKAKITKDALDVYQESANKSDAAVVDSLHDYFRD